MPAVDQNVKCAIFTAVKPLCTDFSSSPRWGVNHQCRKTSDHRAPNRQDPLLTHLKDGREALRGCHKTTLTQRCFGRPGLVTKGINPRKQSIYSLLTPLQGLLAGSTQDQCHSYVTSHLTLTFSKIFTPYDEIIPN